MGVILFVSGGHLGWWHIRLKEIVLSRRVKQLASKFKSGFQVLVLQRGQGEQMKNMFVACINGQKMVLQLYFFGINFRDFF